MAQNRTYCWRLEVKSRGYWFTSGGDKGSFGYYPHLKQVVKGKEYPVYPDTQIHGDMKMSAFWLSKIKPEEFSTDFVSLVFGDKNEQYEHIRQPSCLFVTDLELHEKDRWHDNLFQIKPRIEIDDSKRTVKEHMLVSLEMAYLEGLTLTSKVYLFGDFTEEYFNRAKRLVEQSVKLLSGFGAFRSRGYGRGEIRLIEDRIPLQGSKEIKGNRFIINLQSLVNFRNRQIYPGTEQTLKTEPFITSDKLKAWIVRAYKTQYGKWLKEDEISKLSVSPFYPSMQDTTEITYPAPVTTLKNEEGKIFDLSCRAIIEGSGENLFSTKTKSLSTNCFVIDSKSPVLYETPIHRRIRNSIDESFKTLKEGGLIVQEYIPAGETFKGTLQLMGSDEFNQQLLGLMINQSVLINGCLFRASLTPVEETNRASYNPPYLLTQAIPFDYKEGLINYTDCAIEKTGDRFIRKGANQIRLTTQRSYNTMLNRQRRLRIVIQSGSVINSATDELIKNHEGNLLMWQGFGKDIVRHKKTDTKTQRTLIRDTIPDDINSLCNALIKDGMTRSQAGFLRGYRNEKQDLGFLKKLTKDRVQKYEAKGKPGFKELYKRLGEYLELNNMSQMRIFINKLLDELHTRWWDHRMGMGK